MTTHSVSGGLSIGAASLPHGLMLAPMAGVTDAPFRAVCTAHGADYTVTEMISAKALWYHDKKTARLAAIAEYEMPCAVQIFGSEPEIMAYAAGVLSSPDTPCIQIPAAIDINMGCPMPKIVNNGEGAALMRSPVLAGRIIEAVRGATDLPVTVKIRAGWDAGHKNCTELARIAASLGVACITVHGRTRAQLYAPPVDYDSIAAVRDAVPAHIPVIGNGDIYCAADARRMREITGCDGVMIARGSYGNPWIFEEIAADMDGIPYTPPTPARRLQTAMAHLERLIGQKGDYTGIQEGRRHLAWYTKGLPGSAALRADIMRAATPKEMSDLLTPYLRALEEAEG
ncbi:MAG: tRNA dihydrouridine synthase DusB [Clostridia bacterium]|nr:tRNA dihydrouridine synthase DusB [Clostridia bacterium]